MDKYDLSKVYDDYLFDCHVANKKLTEEDWEYFGREEHHTEIPSRDGGLLTPLNSQPLTTYQHWVAGVLLSEVLQKGCFAMIPKGALPPSLDILRAKWVKCLAKEGNSAWLEKTTPEKRSEDAKGDSTPEERSQRTKKGWENMTPEKRKERMQKSNCNRTPEAKKEASRKRLEKMTPEKTKEASKKRVESTTPEQRSQWAKDRWAKRSPEERRRIMKNATEAAAQKRKEAK
jgi:hypothetical protein